MNPETETTPQFTEFPKIARLSRECVISEKIDGTNGCIFIGENGQFLVGSRTRWITPEQDNHGFAKWAYANREELMRLGPGRHFGEWWGSGIQRGYGLTKGEKRFSLFNSIRWCFPGSEPQPIKSQDPREAPEMQEMQEFAPACCHVVPVLYRGIFKTAAADLALETLVVTGSQAAPGFMKPEGIVCFHIAANMGFKKTIEKDEEPKSLYRP